MRPAFAVVALCMLAPSLEAQDIITGPDYELFPGVEYLGGDARQAGKFYGVLVLRDTSVSLHRCKQPKCAVFHDYVDHDLAPVLSISLRAVREVSSSSQVRGPSAGSRIAWGVFAGDRAEEFVGVVYESPGNVEAPVFKTRRAVSAALEAKLKFRVSKLATPTPAPR